MAESNAPLNEEDTIKAEYEKLKQVRQPYLDRAKTYSTLTLKYLYPDASEGTDTSTMDLQGDWQIDGPLLTNHLANLYMMTLFPPNRSFFKLNISEEEQAVLLEKSGLTKAAVEFALSLMERKARKLMLDIGGRPALLDAIKHLIVAGNALVYYPEVGNMQTYALDEYIVDRDPDGEILTMITKDTKAFVTLPTEIKDAVRKELAIKPEDEESTDVDLFTRIKLDPANTDTDNPNYIIQQAVDAVPVPDTEVAMSKDDLRWIPIGWHRTRRESYFRGLVELIYPALYNVSILSEAVVKGIAVITDIKMVVEPDSIIDIPSMNAAGPGTYHYGEKDAINVVQAGNIGDWSFIKSMIDDYVNKLSRTFLMHVARDSERTTAEEIRVSMRQLETSHGGVYGNLAQTLQMQLCRLLMKGIDASIEDTKVEPTILTGMDALGRSSNNDNIRLWAEDLTLFDAIPDTFKGLIKTREIYTELAAGRDVNFTTFTKTPDELLEEQQTAADQQAETLMLQEGAKGLKDQVAGMDPDDAMDVASGITGG